MTIAGKNSKWYALKYTMSGYNGTPVLAIKAGFAAVQTLLTMVNGTHTVVFRSGASASTSPFSLELSTKGAGTEGFVIDDLSLREIDGPSKLLVPLSVEDYAEIGDP